MYISSKFKCQLSFNWHLNLFEVGQPHPGFYHNMMVILNTSSVIITVH
jgi:hypothetical protein